MPQLKILLSLRRGIQLGNIAYIVQKNIMCIGNIFQHTQAVAHISPIPLLETEKISSWISYSFFFHTFIDKLKRISNLVKTGFNENNFIFV